MRYHVGDKVKVKTLRAYDSYTDEYGNNPLGVAATMSEMSGQIVEIHKLIPNKNAYFIKEDNGYYLWNDAMLIPAKQNKYEVKGGF